MRIVARRAHRGCEGRPTRLFRLPEQGTRAKLASLYAQDTVLIGPRLGVLRGQAAVRLHHDLFRSLPNTSAEGTPRKAEISGDLGFVEGDYVETVRGPTGETTEVRGNFLRVWKRVNGAWRILYDTYTTRTAESAGTAKPSDAAATTRVRTMKGGSHPVGGCAVRQPRAAEREA